MSASSTFHGIIILGLDNEVVKSISFPLSRSDIPGDYVDVSEGVSHHYKNGYLHRENGPASYSDEYEAWFYNGQLHRNDGPAFTFLIEIPNTGKHFFFIRGEDITDDVLLWAIQSEYVPEDYSNWTDAHRALFKLTFAG
jgi:hypothetical protein